MKPPEFGDKCPAEQESAKTKQYQQPGATLRRVGREEEIDRREHEQQDSDLAEDFLEAVPETALGFGEAHATTCGLSRRKPSPFHRGKNQMIAGHLGVALGARALRPKAPWLHAPVVGLNLCRWPAVDLVLERLMAGRYAAMSA
jgi:hypothetical protein